MTLLAHVVRGGLSESRHYGSIAIANAAGELLYSTGPVDSPPTFLRSSAKPFQAIPLIESGAADRFNLTPKEIALACASHNGEDEHVQTVAGMQARAGLTPDELLCGAHFPYYEPASIALTRAGRPPSTLHSNCSGKHTGMLLVCKQMGWPTENYHAPEHPLQQWILEVVAEFCDVPASQIATGVDGCSVVCFGVPVHKMAIGFARLADPSYWEKVGKPEHAKAAKRITEAMMAHPFMVGGTGRGDTDLMESAPGRVFSKVGAEAVWCMGFPGRGLGLAMKVEDGASRTQPVILAEAMRQTGLLNEKEIAAFEARQVKPIRNVRGLAVGEFKADFKLEKIDN